MTDEPDVLVGHSQFDLRKYPHVYEKAKEMKVITIPDANRIHLVEESQQVSMGQGMLAGVLLTMPLWIATAVALKFRVFWFPFFGFIGLEIGAWALVKRITR